MFIQPVDLPDMNVKIPSDLSADNSLDYLPTRVLKDRASNDRHDWEIVNGDMPLARREPDGKDDNSVMVNEDSKSSPVGEY